MFESGSFYNRKGLRREPEKKSDGNYTVTLFAVKNQVQIIC